MIPRSVGQTAGPGNFSSHLPLENRQEFGMTAPTESEALTWFAQLSNWGRWGPDDELGTLNLITPEVRKRAVQTVTEGISISCARDVVTGVHGLESEVTATAAMAGSRLGFAVEKITTLTPHGHLMTHLDALSHIFWDGQMYNGRSADVLAAGGTNALPIEVTKQGVVTRGILLDVAAAKELEWIEPEHGVFPKDLELAETRQGVRVEPGDAVLLRTGFNRYLRNAGMDGSDPGMHQPGWHAACLPWLRERDVSVIGCDSANDVMPSGYPGLILPVHTVGIVAMGLWLIDNCDLEGIAAMADSLSRWEFQLSICPLPLAGLTSSPLNPIALF